MKKALKYVLAQRVVVVLGALCIGVLGAGYFYFVNQNGKEETLVIVPTDFIQEVTSSGKVVAARDVSLGFAQGGRVGSVSVSVGTSVRSGAILAEIENDDLLATYQQRAAVLDVENAKLNALKAGTRPEEVAVAESNVTSAKVVLSQATQALVDTIQSSYTTADSAVRGKVDQFLSGATGSSPKVIFGVTNSQTQTTFETARVSIGTLLSNWSIASAALSVSGDTTSSLATAQENLAQVASFLALANVVVTQGLPTSAVTQANLATYATDVGTARTTINTAIAALTSAATARANAVAALSSAEKSLVLKKAGATADDIVAQEARVKSAEASVDDARAQLKKTRITAPYAGVITEVDAKVGQVASANVPVIAMQSGEQYEIESFIPEINVAYLKEGNPSKVTLDAYGSDTVFDATVVSIDPAETIKDGVSTYRARLTFVHPDTRVRVGMTANVVTRTDVRSQVLQVPQKVVINKNGSRYVYVKEPSGAVLRPVTVGAISSQGTIEITSGLVAGEEVITSPRL